MKRLVYRTRQVLELLSLSRSQLHRLVTSGRFPAPIQLGGSRAVGFVAAEVDRWLAERAAARATRRAETSVDNADSRRDDA